MTLITLTEQEQKFQNSGLTLYIKNLANYLNIDYNTLCGAITDNWAALPLEKRDYIYYGFCTSLHENTSDTVDVQTAVWITDIINPKLRPELIPSMLDMLITDNKGKLQIVNTELNYLLSLKQLLNKENK